MSDEKDLPTAAPGYPNCGACSYETELLGDDYVCTRCQIGFAHTDYTGFYLDAQSPTCGEACDNKWHAPGAVKPGWGFECRQCCLPLGHTSLHYAPCRTIKIGGKSS